MAAIKRKLNILQQDIDSEETWRRTRLSVRQAMAGIVKTRGELTKALLKERAEDLKREERKIARLRKRLRKLT